MAMKALCVPRIKNLTVKACALEKKKDPVGPFINAHTSSKTEESLETNIIGFGSYPSRNQARHLAAMLVKSPLNCRENHSLNFNAL